MAVDPLPRQLAELTRLLAQMGTATAEAMGRATCALLERRERLAHQVIIGDGRVDALRAQVEELATEALLLHAPVAGDLRATVAAIRAAGDLERMGDLAVHIAQAAQRGESVPGALCASFTEMGRVAVAMALKTTEVARSRNVLLAAELAVDDDAMDRLHRHLFTVLLDPGWGYGIRAAVDLTLLARDYERFADHAVLVAREIAYAVTGRTPDAFSTIQPNRAPAPSP